MEKLMTKTNKLLAAFENGEELTAAQMKSRFGIANPHDAVRALRNSGYAIYLNKGKQSSKYRLGTPTRAIVAAGIAALGTKEAGLAR
jgi:Helix-turn-helix domain